MNIDSLIAEIKTDFESYDEAGLIDEVSLYRWALIAIKRFGENVTTLQETVIEVKNGTAILPKNFYSLYVAYECSKRGVTIPKEEDKGVIQSSLMWKERVTRTNEWSSCDPSCVTESEDTIVERVYMGTSEAKFLYNRPVMLSLGKKMNRNQCHKECRNKIIKDNPNEITINNNTLYANFNSGDIYMQYYGIDKDEEGRLVIPDTDKGEVANYVEYYLKYRFIEKVALNGDDKSAMNMMGFLDGKVKEHLALAMTDSKFSTLSPASFKRIKNKNRAEMWKYENMFSIKPGEYYNKGHQR